MSYHEAEIINNKSLSIVNHLPKIGINNVKEEIISGLLSSPKTISSKFFYDRKGSELFEAITELDEYYPTRSEKNILETLGRNLEIDFTNLNIIELGSGDPSKISLLLQQIPNDKLPTIIYHPVDISKSAILGSAQELAKEYPMIRINGVIADFIHQFDLTHTSGRKLYCFFGSTIGNLVAQEQVNFLSGLGKAMNPGDSFLLGLDMVKDVDVLENAYNDDHYITAAFNRNILNVVNNLAGTDFDTNHFDHHAFYNKDKDRIEMHLKSTRDQIISLNGSLDKITIKKGELIHTENSHKFSKDSIENMALWAGLTTKKIFTDGKEWFSLVHYVKN